MSINVCEHEQNTKHELYLSLLNPEQKHFLAVDTRGDGQGLLLLPKVIKA